MFRVKSAFQTVKAFWDFEREGGGISLWSECESASCQYFGFWLLKLAQSCVCVRHRCPCGTPQTDDSAGLAEALSHVDAWERASPASKCCEGQVWPRAAAYLPLIKAKAGGAHEASSLLSQPPVLLSSNQDNRTSS